MREERDLPQCQRAEIQNDGFDPDSASLKDVLDWARDQFEALSDDELTIQWGFSCGWICCAASNHFKSGGAWTLDIIEFLNEWRGTDEPSLQPFVDLFLSGDDDIELFPSAEKRSIHAELATELYRHMTLLLDREIRDAHKEIRSRGGVVGSDYSHLDSVEDIEI